MKTRSKILFLSVFAAPAILLSSEPSAFGAGDLTSPDPYGLTTSEEVILETKKKLKKVAQKSTYQENQLDSLRERIDGLQSVLESLSRKVHNNKVQAQSSGEYEQRLAKEIEQSKAQLANLKVTLQELVATVDEINLHYVTKKEYNALVDEINALKKRSGSKKRSTKSKKSNFALAKDAKKYYDKRYFTKAIALYEELIERNYKPAYAHYMIGEMNFKRKNYAQALSYFKKSTMLYDKASYMPTLMLHSALSMEKTGDTKHAKAFFKAIVKKYPDSSEAKEAKKHL